MRPVEKGIILPAGHTTILAPGGLHIMLIGLHYPLVEHHSVQMTLNFERAGEVNVSVCIKSKK
jgi:copper(I)-binding protein